MMVIFFLLLSVSATAQIKISDFRQIYTDGTASDYRTSVHDPDGRPCAVLKLETGASGWTFDAGLAGIMDTRYEKGVIWLYVPASARTITVAHKLYGSLRRWAFPVSLEAGRTYTMKLSYEQHRQPAPTTRTSISTPAPPSVPQQSRQQVVTSSAPSRHDHIIPAMVGNDLCKHFIDFRVGLPFYRNYEGSMEADDYSWYGFSYTWIGNRIGPYITVASDLDGLGSVIGGAAFRITDPVTALFDWQVYGGLGLIYGQFSADIGTRFGLPAPHSVSHWDFGFGCQFSKGMIMPTVSVGLYVWGIPVVVGLSLALCVLGEEMGDYY